jgi:hypothetical protein
MPRHPAQPRAAALGALLAALAAAGAEAKVYAEWQPRVAVGGGYDDNILLDGSGGDPFAQLVPGLKLYLFGDHSMRATFDCQIAGSRLQHPDKYPAANGDLVVNQLCGGEYHTRLGTRTALRFNIREQYAQDPFAVNNLGLLLRPGQTQIFYSRTHAELSYRATQYGTVLMTLDGNTLFFKPGDPGNGTLLAPRVAYERRFTPRDSWSVGVREQTFFALGAATVATQQTWGLNTTGIGAAALGGYSHHFSPVMLLEVHAGPAAIFRPEGNSVLPVAQVDVEAETPTAGFHFTALHDLQLGPSRGGPLVGDLAEVAAMTTLWPSVLGRVRGGLYRNEIVGAPATGIVGYSVGVGLDFKLNRAWTLGGAFGREARLTGDAIANAAVDRNVTQVRLTWEHPRDW